jgi:cyclic dehypoxanthinyl futalosine synthase
MARNPDPEVRRTLARAVAGDRISGSEAVVLLRRGDLHDLGRAAHAVRNRLHPDGVVSYVIDRNVNYTNICDTSCKFCAFYRQEGDADAYVLDRDMLSRKIEETKAVGGRQILLQGGNHPGLGIEWYEDLIRFIKGHGIHLHGFSPSEIQCVARVSNLTIEETIRRLREAGLDTIPGGGAEILVERVRRRISPLKTKSHEWLDVMREAHRQGMRTTATMMFGHRESIEDRVEHLLRLRQLQDETGGFTAFIAWTFQTENTKIRVPPAGSVDYLRTLAVSRLVLDNVANIQSSWVTQGGQIGQAALLYGANDMGSTMIEENVVSAAGTVYALDETGLRRLIRDAGFAPRRRNVYYEHLPEPEAEMEAVT